MADLERIKPMDEAQLANVLTGTLAPSQRRLNDEELLSLSVLVGQMAQRYPSQDLEQSLEGYLADFEQLALKYSLRKVQDALGDLRIRGGQKFFPRPDEVDEEIERSRERKMVPTANDAQRYLDDLKRWRIEHANYMRDLEAQANGEKEGTGTAEAA